MNQVYLYSIYPRKIINGCQSNMKINAEDTEKLSIAMIQIETFQYFVQDPRDPAKGYDD